MRLPRAHKFQVSQGVEWPVCMRSSHPRKYSLTRNEKFPSRCGRRNPTQEGTLSTASHQCRVRLQRLRNSGNHAPEFPGSSGSGPWALRPKRLQWLTNIRSGFKIAASLAGLWLFVFPQNSASGQGTRGAFPSFLLSLLIFDGRFALR